MDHKELISSINSIKCFPIENMDELQKTENKELVELRNKAEKYLAIGMTFLGEKYMDQLKERAIVEVCKQKHINLYISAHGSFTNREGKEIYNRFDLKAYPYDLPNEIFPYIEKASALFSSKKLQIWRKNKSLDPLLILYVGCYNPDFRYYYIELMRWE